ncbi:MAG TPA: DUF222 domain-containing protein [Aeromicrobium sp.]|nr:DUF222 domain-containing protein [Aeromicrobium sp.]HKY57056.1 DUF222 domain-containing protein [Aeromicrobium sp.]
MTAELITETTLADRLARINIELNAIALSDYPCQSHAQARETAAALRRLQSRLATHVGAAVRAVEWTSPGRTAAQNIARDFGNDNRAAQRELNDAQTTSKASMAEQAAADGTISHRHATVIGRALADLPADTTAEQRTWCEKALIRDAAHYSPTDLATRGRRITDQFKPEPEVDTDEDALLRRREAMARAKTSLSLWDNHDGTWSGRFTIPELHGRILKTVTDAHTAPRRSHLDPTADPFEPLDKRQGKAFCSILEHIPTDGLPTSGGTPIRIVVTISEDKLRSKVAAATLATGERLSAGQLRRLAANHGIIPAVLGSDSIPVDLGRTQRLFSKAQRDALAVMDGGCTAPGCDRPPSWCEVQHTRPWAHDGNTDLSNATLHCSACHHRADQEGWKYKRVKGRMHINRGKGWELNHRYRP